MRPHAEALSYMVRKGIQVQDVLDAAENLGRELVKTGRMTEENLRIVSRELVSLETYVEMTNKGFKQVLDRLTKTENPL